MMHPAAIAALSEYSAAPDPGAAARDWAAVGTTRPIADDRDYTRSVRRVLRAYARRDEAFAGLAGVDGRLLAVGYCQLPPVQMARLVPGWLAAWRRAAAVPDVVGSSHNAGPGAVWCVWRRYADRPGQWAMAAAALRTRPEAGIVLASRDTRTCGPRRALRIARALARQGAPCLGYAATSSWFAACGRLSPEAQGVIADAMTDLPRPWTAAMIPWTVVAPQIRALGSDRARAAARIVAADRDGRQDREGRPRLVDRRTEALLGGQPVCPAYPAVNILAGARLALGARPVDLAPGLTRAEAHSWLLAGAAEEPARWLVRRAGLDVVCRDVPVARWIVACEADPRRRDALRAERTAIVGGERRTWTALSRLDEVAAEDVRAPSDGGMVVMERLAQRLGASFYAANRSNYEVLYPAPRLSVYRACRWLRTPADLIAEGEALGHCVGGYVDRCRRGQSWILALRVGKVRSTVEVNPETLAIRQHFGPGNSTPAPELARLLDRLVQRWRRQ